MRFGWSGAVINTMLGSTTGHTFGSGRRGKHKHMLSILLSKTVLDSFLIQWLCLTSLLPFLPSPLAFSPSVSPFGMYLWNATGCIDFLFIIQLCACILAFFICLSFLTCTLPTYFLITSFYPHCSSSPCFPFVSFPSFEISLFRLHFFPSLLQDSPLSFSSPHRHRPLSPTVCVRLQAHVCPDTAVPCPTSAVKHLVNYTVGQREGR